MPYDEGYKLCYTLMWNVHKSSDMLLYLATVPTQLYIRLLHLLKFTIAILPTDLMCHVEIPPISGFTISPNAFLHHALVVTTYFIVMYMWSPICIHDGYYMHAYKLGMYWTNTTQSTGVYH